MKTEEGNDDTASNLRLPGQLPEAGQLPDKEWILPENSSRTQSLNFGFLVSRPV